MVATLTPADRARAECEAQGVPFVVTDPEVYRRLGVILQGVTVPANDILTDNGRHAEKIRRAAEMQLMWSANDAAEVSA